MVEVNRVSPNSVKNQRLKRIRNEKQRLHKIILWITFALEDLIRMFRPLIGSRIAEAVSTDNEALKSTPETPSSSNMVLKELHAGKNIMIGDGDIWELNFPENPSNKESDRIYCKIQEYQSGLNPILLQPGNGLVKQFVLRARKSLFFTPIEYTFQIQIKYAVDDMEQLEVIPFKLDIRSAIRSTILGSIIGGVVGTVAQTLSKGQPIALGPIALAAIFSAVAVVAFARKTNTQQIISVEDFWGGFFIGFFIGFLIGYLGEGFFRNIIGQNP